MLKTTARSPLQIEIRELLKIAVPLASAQVAQSATGFADTIMMGRMGADVLAAGGLAALIFLSILTATTGVVMGVSPLVAEAFGAGQQSRIQRVARQGLWLSVMTAIPSMIVMGHFDRWMIQAGQDEAIVRLADSYLDIMLWGLFPVIGFASLRAFVSALSQAQPVMIIVIAGTAFNIVGNYGLGFGKLGLPQMGLAGLALASVIAQWGMFIALALYVAMHPKLKDYRIFQELYRLRPRVLWQLIWVGVPIGVFSGLESGFFLVIMFWIGTLGTEALAAHQIVLQTIVI
ncbi:MAG: MATE family efflux transporter, partial [Cyanobacteria bacterium J06627_8]